MSEIRIIQRIVARTFSRNCRHVPKSYQLFVSDSCSSSRRTAKRRDAANKRVGELLPTASRQVPFGQQQPIVSGVFDRLCVILFPFPDLALRVAVLVSFVLKHASYAIESREFR